jgi:glycosyltransferase involved in cell wall biosynthesis
MKICIIVDDYLPESIKIAAKMMHELACELKTEGHEVTVVTPSPKLKKRMEIGTLDGVTICRFKSGEIKNIGKIKRAINETLLPFYAWRAYGQYFKKHPHDIIVYYSPTIFWGRLAARLKRVWNAPSYLILRDLFPQWAVDQGLIRKGSVIEKYFRYFEAVNYASADTIGLMSQKNMEWFRENSQTQKKLEILYNWASDTPTEADGSYRKKLGLEKKCVYFYGGNIGHAQDMMNIIRLAVNMRDEERAHFVLVGAGDEVELVENAIKEHGLTNMTLLPAVSQGEFAKMQAEFDIGLFSLHHDHITHNFPGKLLGYMVQSMPLLGSINPGNDLMPVVEKAGAGMITINGDDEGLLNNALKLLHDDDFRITMGRNAKQLLHDTFSVEAAAKQILKSVE